MIQIYCLEDLTIEEIDLLIERGVVFDVTSKTSVLPKTASNNDRDAFWGFGDKSAEDIRQAFSK